MPITTAQAPGATDPETVSVQALLDALAEHMAQQRAQAQRFAQGPENGCKRASLVSFVAEHCSADTLASCLRRVGARQAADRADALATDCQSNLFDLAHALRVATLNELGVKTGARPDLPTPAQALARATGVGGL